VKREENLNEVEGYYRYAVPGKLKMPEITQSQGSISKGKSNKSRDHRSPLEELLEASTDAERLISCFFDLNAIEGEPFQGIWDRLASAIGKAQRAVRVHCTSLQKPGDETFLSRRPV
jgi:hypothetical protein